MSSLWLRKAWDPRRGWGGQRDDPPSLLQVAPACSPAPQRSRRGQEGRGTLASRSSGGTVSATKEMIDLSRVDLTYHLFGCILCLLFSCPGPVRQARGHDVPGYPRLQRRRRVRRPKRHCATKEMPRRWARQGCIISSVPSLRSPGAAAWGSHGNRAKPDRYEGAPNSVSDM